MLCRIDQELAKAWSMPRSEVEKRVAIRACILKAKAGKYCEKCVEKIENWQP
jgi:hypothetical protein